MLFFLRSQTGGPQWSDAVLRVVVGLKASKTIEEVVVRKHSNAVLELKSHDSWKDLKIQYVF